MGYDPEFLRNHTLNRLKVFTPPDTLYSLPPTFDPVGFLGLSIHVVLRLPLPTHESLTRNYHNEITGRIASDFDASAGKFLYGRLNVEKFLATVPGCGKKKSAFKRSVKDLTEGITYCVAPQQIYKQNVSVVDNYFATDV